MPEAPEIPEAKDPFEKQVAISIAALAVALSVIGNKGDNAKTDAIIQTNESANQWARFQSKSIKGTIARAESDILARIQAVSADTPKHIDWLKNEITRYDADEKEISALAKTAREQAIKSSEINDRCDHAALALQIAIVIASVSILSRWRVLWFIALALGAVGTVIGISAFRL